MSIYLRYDTFIRVRFQDENGRSAYEVVSMGRFWELVRGGGCHYSVYGGGW
ncbi:MAG: hypothetical protein GY805_31765 [Chloroflexi bacterium]|nr:hypothetical protein [Chloroflexota bacterium]